MASTIIPFKSTGIRSSSFVPANRKPELQRLKSHSSSKWWTPLFGWSSDPDYMDESVSSSEADLQVAPASRSTRFAPGGFTEEKAKQLRARTLESATFHDIMYHSAIASRLASDVPNMSGR